ncbi:MAG: RsmD family RNA methyltransferase, partial [Oscillospiraceae bacterium]|nr:RsmD family RNA methyltransferase [Oscillospiraceae bacterium]
MRVITGAARGKPLETLAGDEVVRPTAERVKEGLFSAVQFY